MSHPKSSILISPWVDISTLKDYRLSPKFEDCKDIGEISFFVGTYEIFLPDILELSEIMENENIEHNLIVKDKKLYD